LGDAIATITSPNTSGGRHEQWHDGQSQRPREGSSRRFDRRKKLKNEGKADQAIGGVKNAAEKVLDKA
jgi:hypothetical protein